MSHKGEPAFSYHIFDYVKDGLDKPYVQRMEDLEALDLPKYCVKVLPIYINNKKELDLFLDVCMQKGYEGVILRPVESPYDCKRGNNLLKIKCWRDSEATIIGYEQKKHNDNEKEEDAFGHSKRSSKKEGIVLLDTIGALHVRDFKTGAEFKIGTGMDDAMREDIWENREAYLGKLVKYKFQKEGQKKGSDVPRFPVFLGFRHEDDL
jgi:DNA ligase-1